ncbi:MAG TPA: hypothetical protein VH394_13360, partial [Thermoanaerobaculia bacterium]|nr:hypothetical protein [Thermoanaerobaculia bacterium]
FICLGLALFTTKYLIKADLAFLYYTILILSVSYSHVVEYLPGFKAPYVASTITIPVLIVARNFPSDSNRLSLVAAAVFFFVLGREMCMDFLDRTGDAFSFMHKIAPSPLAIISFSVQLVACIILLLLVENTFDLLALLLIVVLFVLSGIHWLKKPRTSIILMKLELFIGLYFLI